MRKIKNKAQGFIEYAVLIILIAAALVAMKVYMSRSVQEKYRQAGDVFGEGNQYASGVTKATNTSKSGGIISDTSPEVDICAIMAARVEAMQKELGGYAKADGEEVIGLIAQKESLKATIAQTNMQILELQAAGGVDYISAVTKLNSVVKTLEEQVAELDVKIEVRETKIAGYKAGYPDCF